MQANVGIAHFTSSAMLNQAMGQFCKAACLLFDCFQQQFSTPFVTQQGIGLSDTLEALLKVSPCPWPMAKEVDKGAFPPEAETPFMIFLPSNGLLCALRIDSSVNTGFIPFLMILDSSAHTHFDSSVHTRVQWGWGWGGVGWGANNVPIHFHTQALCTDHVGLVLGWGGVPLMFVFTSTHKDTAHW